MYPSLKFLNKKKEREVEGALTHTEEKPGEDRGGRNRKMLALKTGVMWPQAKGHWQPPDAGRGQKEFSQSLEGGRLSAP